MITFLPQPVPPPHAEAAQSKYYCARDEDDLRAEELVGDEGDSAYGSRKEEAFYYVKGHHYNMAKQCRSLFLLRFAVSQCEELSTRNQLLL